MGILKIPSKHAVNCLKSDDVTLTLFITAVVPKRHPLFEMIFWNNCVWLNMCRAVLNVEHFERWWVWLSFNTNFYKDGTPPVPTSVHQCLYNICKHRGPGWLGTVSQDFQPIFVWLKIFNLLRLHMNRQKRFSKIFCFPGDIRLQSAKIGCQRSQQLRGHPIFSLDTGIFIFLMFCYWMCKHI